MALSLVTLHVSFSIFVCTARSQTKFIQILSFTYCSLEYRLSRERGEMRSGGTTFVQLKFSHYSNKAKCEIGFVESRFHQGKVLCQAFSERKRDSGYPLAFYKKRVAHSGQLFALICSKALSTAVQELHLCTDKPKVFPYRQTEQQA